MKSTMKRYIKNDYYSEELDDITCMSNVLGEDVVHPGKLPFSFYYSTREGVPHSIRVKPIFDDSKMSIKRAGNLKLSDDWKYTPETGKKHIDHSAVRYMKEFFKDNIVLFCLVWDMQVNEPLLGKYLDGRLTLNEFIQKIDFYEDYKKDLDAITSVHELEDFCRSHHLVNFHGN